MLFEKILRFWSKDLFCLSNGIHTFLWPPKKSMQKKGGRQPPLAWDASRVISLAAELPS
jgi:hypothetical protein